jgi:hypothetical protein
MSKELAEGSETGFNELIAHLREMQSLRRFCIKSQIRSNNSLEHLLSRAMGYHTHLPEDERKGYMNAARKIRAQVEKALQDGAEPDADPRIPPAVFAMIHVSRNSRQYWDQERARREADMIAAARLLPVWPWVQSISGIAELGLAVLVGEAGDIGNYPAPGKLWKRLGLACYDGSRQGFVPAEITGEDRKKAWMARGYNPARRAEVYAFVDDTMLRAQWRGDKDEHGVAVSGSDRAVATAAHAIGPYGQVYGDRRSWNAARGLMPAHADKEARRFMSKRFIRDLWTAWQDTHVERLTIA